MRFCVLLLAIGCSKPVEHKDWSCEPLPFAASTPVPEASAAAWLPIDGKPMLVVVSDSGQHGAYGLIDPETGETKEQGKLPLGDGGDDLEGLAARDGLLYGLMSNGWMRVWKRAGNGFELAQGPYAIGEGDLTCDKARSNCARDYEGLCLAPDPATRPCTGYAASRSDGKLYCLMRIGDQLLVNRGEKIEITSKGKLADCAYDDTGGLWAANNLFGLSQVYRIEHGEAQPVAQLGVGFPEVIAVRGDVVYRMSDAGGSPSLMAKFRCTAPTR